MSNLSSAFSKGVQAILAGDLDALRAVLDRIPEVARERGGPPGNPTLLHYSSFNGFDECCFPAPVTMPALARLLIERGAEPDALAFGNARSTPLSWNLSSWWTCASGVQESLADAYLDGGAALEGIGGDGAPLGHAIAFGYTRAVEHLAARGARTNDLVAAAALGHLDRLRSWWRPDGTFAPDALAFSRGTKDEAGRFSWPPPRDPDPLTIALRTASTHGRAEVVRWLLDVGADANRAMCMDQTALHFAATSGHAEVVELLLVAGARTDVRERQFERTPAEWARETGESAIAARLDSLSGGTE